MATATSKGTTIARISRTMTTIGRPVPVPRVSAMRAGLRVRAACGYGAAFRHRRRGAADRIGLIEIGDRIGERRRRDRAGTAELAPWRRRHRVDGGEMRIGIDEVAAQLGKRIVRQFAAERVRQGAQDRPVLARVARREDGAARRLDAAFEIDVDAVLLAIGGTGQDDIGAPRSGIAVLALIDAEGATEPRHRDLVGAEQADPPDLALLAAGPDGVAAAPAGTRHEADIYAADAGRGPLQH